MTATAEPVGDQVIRYLFRLRKSGATNMWGATPYIQRAFPFLSKKEAQGMLTDWIKNYDRYKVVYNVKD